MNRNLTFPLICLFLLPTLLIAQQRGNGQGNTNAGPPVTITGKILDASTKALLEFATITLFRQQDSTMVTGAISETNGGFSLEARPGRYFIQVDFIGFQSSTLNDVIVPADKRFLELGEISLSTEASVLDAIEVRAEKSTMQLSLDKKVFNVGKDLANSGGTAADVLDNVPSVTVDVEGNVELRGAGGVRILVDGKPSGLIGISNSDGLRNLPANMIDRIEVVTNPSARYEAEGMSGIINIVLKKDRKKGLNGSFDLTGGLPKELGAALNMNYRRDKFNFFSSYSIRNRRGPGFGNLYQEFYKDGTTFITENNSRRTRGGISNNIRFGADYYFNESNILTTAFNYRYSNDDNFNRIQYRDYVNDLSNLVEFTERTDDEVEKEPNLEYSLTYKKLFERKNHELTFDFRYQDEEESESSVFVEKHFLSDEITPSGIPDLQQRSKNVEGNSNLIFQMDYVFPFSNDGKLEAGLRSGIRNIKNDFKVEQVEDAQWVALDNFTNNLLYDENIHAAYTTYGNKFGKYSFQAGLRAEYSEVRTELVQTNEINPRDYFNFFPSVFLGYEINEKNTFQVSYSRRIRRPGFWELNPFLTFSDARNIWGGNPDLNPEYTNSYEAGYLKYFEKGSLTSSVFYRHTNDVIERIQMVTSDTSSETRPRNLSTREDYGLEFTFSFDPTKKWRLNGNVNFFRSQTNGEFEGQDFSADTYTWFGRLSSRVTVFKKVDLQVNFNYRAPRKNTQGKSLAMWNVDPAASMDILKGKGTLTLSVRDLFNTRLRRYTTVGDSFYVEGEWRWRARQTTLTFNYRLNQNKQRGGNREGRGGDGDGGEF
ncbi:MAG: TonB-dependent receptor [Saprospiraceae bacterium]